MGKVSTSVLVQGYLYSKEGTRVPIALEITDPAIIEKVHVGMIGDFEILGFELADKMERNGP